MGLQSSRVSHALMDVRQKVCPTFYSVGLYCLATEFADGNLCWKLKEGKESKRNFVK